MFQGSGVLGRTAVVMLLAATLLLWSGRANSKADGGAPRAVAEPGVLAIGAAASASTQTAPLPIASGAASLDAGAVQSPPVPVVPSKPLRDIALDPANRFPDTVVPGQTLTLSGTFEFEKKPWIKLHSLGTDRELIPSSIDVVPKQIKLNVPDNIPSGRYYVTIEHDGWREIVVPSEVRVATDAVKLDSAHPTTAYGDSKGSFDFDVLGQNFSAIPSDNQIYVAGQGAITKHQFADKSSCEIANNRPCLWVESSERLHVMGYTSEPYQGPLSLSVRVGNARSPESQLVLSRMSEAGVLVWTIVLFGVLCVVVYRLVLAGVRSNVIDGRRYTPLWSFFIDRQSNTYSLSKLQLVAFFAVFVFAYLHVFLCSWLVQWNFTLPDVPRNVSAILAMSTGTTIASTGATLVRGSKGAGDVRPSAADFVSSGGQVVPERFQYFVWLIVACTGFLALLLSQNPATIKAFPNFPDGLLYVMGVSATGYVGGKLARQAGPVLRNIAWKPATAGPLGQITVQGANLSREGDFFIDGQKLPIDPNAEKSLVEAKPQDQASDRSFCSELIITIGDVAALDLSQGEHLFRIVNKDGQYADIRFTSDPPKIQNVKLTVPVMGGPLPETARSIRADTREVLVTILGVGFRSGSTVRWTPVNAKEPTDLPGAAVQVKSPTEIEAKLVPGEAGSACLAVVLPNGFSATTMVSVWSPKEQQAIPALQVAT